MLATFAREMPTWCHDGLSALLAGRGTKKGDPLSWRHYIYGLQHLGLEHMRDQMKIAEAVRLGRSDQESFEPWHKAMTSYTAVPREG